LNIDYIVNNSLAGKTILSQLNKNHKSNLDDFKKTEKSLKIEESKIISQKNVLEKNEYQKQISLLKEKIITYKNSRNKKIKMLKEQKTKAQSELIEILNPILSNYAKENSISIIMPQKNIIIGKSELDITKTILEILNKKIKVIKLQ
jgi:Skp family chaperone for outer membrane proteins